jgi:hypothetical protein
MPIKQTIWGCQYGCRKKYMSKKRMEHHEEICFRNPARRACPSCFYDEQGLCHAGIEKSFPGAWHQVGCYKWRFRDREGD